MGFRVVDVRPWRAVRFVISDVLALEVVVAILGISSHNYAMRREYYVEADPLDSVARLVGLNRQ